MIYRTKIWQPSPQHSCRGASQISEWLEKSKPEPRGSDTSRDLAVRRPSAQWIEAQLEASLRILPAELWDDIESNRGTVGIFYKQKR